MLHTHPATEPPPHTNNAITRRAGTVLGLTKHIVAGASSDKPLELPGLAAIDNDLAQVIHNYRGTTLILDHVTSIDRGSLGVMLGVGSNVTHISLKHLETIQPEDLEILAQIHILRQQEAERAALTESRTAPQYDLNLSPIIQDLVDRKAAEIWQKKFGSTPVEIPAAPLPPPLARPAVSLSATTTPALGAPAETHNPTTRRRFMGAIAAIGLAVGLGVRACAPGADLDSTTDGGSESSDGATVDTGSGSASSTEKPEPPSGSTGSVITVEKKAPEKKESPVMATLKARFENHMERHPGILWSDMVTAIMADPGNLEVLKALEAAGGEPDVIFTDKYVVFADTVANVPAARLGTSYLDASAKAASLGVNVKLISDRQYFMLQRWGVHDDTSSVWLRASPEVTTAGNAAPWAKRSSGGSGSGGRFVTNSDAAETGAPDRGYRFSYSIIRMR